VAREVVRVVEALQAETVRAVGLGEHVVAVRDRLVDVQEPGELLRKGSLRERVVVVHRAVAAARLQDAVIDAGIEHLRDHELGRRLDRLHADRHVLYRVLLALVHEFEPAVAADAEVDILESCPGVVAITKQQPRLHAHAVAHPEGLRRRARDVLLDVFQVDVDGGMSAGAVPVLKHVGMAVDDHSGHLRTIAR
jgi:hypothetical protein